MTNGTPAWARHYVSYTPIVDFRIEPAAGHLFSVLVRRQRGATVTFLIVSTAFTILIPIVFFYHVFVTPGPSPTAMSGSGNVVHSSGMPPCALPLVAVLFAVIVWRTLRGDKTQLAGLRGDERWELSPTSVGPPVDITGDVLPALLAGTGHIRASVDLINGKWVIDFAAANRNLYLGPFRSEELAHRCEAELRRRFPRWFTDPVGIARLSVVADGLNTRANLPPEPIVSVKPILAGDGELRLELERLQGPRPYVGGLAGWLALWLASVIFLGWLVFPALTGGPPRKGSHSSSSGTGFLLFFLLFWTAIGSVFTWFFTLCLRRSETWKFTKTAIITGRNWQHISIRRLPIDQTVQVRFGPFADPPSVDFISQGKLLHLGPFDTWDLAGEAMGDLERQFPHWQWPSPPEGS